MNDEQSKRYERAMHGMQAGVALDETHDPKNLEPKHLRVGINSALTECASLAMLLVKKGVITEEEYFEAIVDGVEREHAVYEAAYTARFGRKVVLV